MISVIMGVYNIASLKVFRHAMQSVMNQTYDDFEFIICDDGSTDGTWRILLNYRRKDRRIKLLRNKHNQGLAATLNRCIKHSKGDYIARQDVDDISDVTRFEKQITYLNLHPELSFVGANVKLYDESGIWGTRNFLEFPGKNDFLFGQPFVHGSLMFRKEGLKVVHSYRVSKETRRAEDYDLLMRMYSKGMHGGNYQEYLYSFMEDRKAQGRRKYCYRLDEVKVRYIGFKRMGVLHSPINWLYVVKPIVVGLIPGEILKYMKLKTGIYRNINTGREPDMK